MNITRRLISTMGITLLVLASGVANALSIADYNFDDTALVDTLLGFSGDFQSYDSNGGAIAPALLEARITDLDGATWVAGVNGDETMDLRFGGTTVINGDGVDLAVFMVGNPTSVEVTLLDHPSAGSLIFNGVYTGTDYLYQSVLYGLEVALIDLDAFGLAAGEAMGDLRLDGWSAISLVGAFNTAVTPVPVPAAVWLFGSGLLGLVGVVRRRSA